MFKVNRYFADKVASIAFRDGNQPATIGVMAAGEYQFSTTEKETMQVISGALTVKLPGAENWQEIPAGGEFVVAAGQVFQVTVAADSAYLCLYGE